MDIPKNLQTPDLTHPSEVRSLLLRMDFHPSRILGQNFLIDRNILNILLDAAEIVPADSLLEVGPGLGVLTEALLARGAHLTAIEKDPRLATWLRTRFAAVPNLTLIESDALQCDWPALCPPSAPVKLVANLPYAIAARLLVELTALPSPPRRMVVTVQREVAARLAAAPATADYGLLTILLQRRYAVTTVKHISPTCFWPPPEVHSSISCLDLLPEPLGGPLDEPTFRRILRLAFSQRRKTLARTLRPETADPVAALQQASLPPTARAEELSPLQWARLVQILTSAPQPSGSSHAP